MHSLYLGHVPINTKFGEGFFFNGNPSDAPPATWRNQVSPEHR